MEIKTLKDIPALYNKTVFLTVDFNITLSNGKISNITRIKKTLPTISYLTEKGAKIILCSHLGRPKGKDKSFSLNPVARELSLATGRKVNLIPDFSTKKALQTIKQCPKNNLVLLENVRFDPREEANDKNFSQHLASMADIFVNDAFGTSHRIHSSIVGITEFLPSFAGLLLEQEVIIISKAVSKPKRPFLVIIGGAKMPEKISVIEKLLDIADTIFLGGGVATTFLAAWGFGMGKSLVDYEMVEMARGVFWKASRKHSAINLPVDVMVSDSRGKQPVEIIPYNHVTQNHTVFDIGPKSIKYLKKQISRSKTIIWNGPLGLQEDDRFKKGTRSTADSLFKHNKADSIIIGGGDTIKNADDNLLNNPKIHVSTGGSAMLKFIEKGTLPGVDVLRK